MFVAFSCTGNWCPYMSVMVGVGNGVGYEYKWRYIIPQRSLLWINCRASFQHHDMYSNYLFCLIGRHRFHSKPCTCHAPVPLSIFRSNSKFDENSKHSSVKYTRPITTIFCTRHDSVTVVTCAKYRCDRSGIYKTRAFWIFIEFRIRSKYA